jgi:hypothetical protein
MRQVVSEAWLRDQISAHMAANVMGSGSFWARPFRCKRNGNGPNWQHAFNPAAVPAGYVEAWERLRPKFEEAYDLADQ